MLTGPLGLNTTPNARMAKTGEIKAGVSTMDPYLHGFIGFQLAKPLFISFRQTAEISNITDNPDRLYPGVDLKLRLIEEDRYRPEISVGLQSAIGHKRMAGEYIALSKRYKDFDFTAGLGWGRFGSAGHFENPLKSLHNHFNENRSLDGENPNDPSDWFTGDKIGFFAGLEYKTPIEHLNLKLDYGADRYTAELAALDYERPAPWGFGLAYQPFDWANLSVGMQGTDKVMGRLSFKTNLKNIRTKGEDKPYKTQMRPFRTNLALPAQMELSARKDNLHLFNAKRDGLFTAHADLELQSPETTPYMLGQSAIHMSNHAGPAVEALHIRPTIMGLHGPTVKMLRRDLEKAIAHHHGSAEEIWRNVAFDTNDKTHFTKLRRTHRQFWDRPAFSVTLDQQASLSEEDNGVLYRNALITGYKGPRLFGLLDQGYAMRINMYDNLHKIREIRPQSLLPVRSDVDQFAERAIALDRSYLALTHSFKSDLHVSLMGGYLEEMYGGVGGEILYRPFKSRFAFGAEAWQSFKRDPDSTLNLSFNGDHVLSAHANMWYDLPHHDLTLKASVGRFLAEDFGGTLSLQKNFKNGITLEGFVTLSDNADFDLFGDTTHAYHGVRLNIPFYRNKRLPEGLNINTRVEPFGRDIGQRIDTPVSLYNVTNVLSFPHIIKHWGDITE